MSKHYSMDDYLTVEKYDVHSHVITFDPRLIELSRQDRFSLLSINVDVEEFPPIQAQQDIATHHKAAFPDGFAYSTSFKIDNWNTKEWKEQTIAYLKESFSKGAIAVKVWKNIGMELLDLEGNFVMIDHPGFDPVLDFIQENNITLIGHLGEPRNCWLPLEQMTVSGDRDYFGKHPEFHMYLHPEYPSYEEQMRARDRMLEKHPHLRFVGAHLGSLEYDVDQLATRFDKYPNMAVDMAERISHLQHQAVTNWEKVRDFVLKYQDRLLYGTDLIDEGIGEREHLKHHAHAVRLNHWKFFSSDQTMSSPKVDHQFKGLHLPKEIINKIYKTNAEYWFPGLSSTKGREESGKVM